jgi:hypothetical protein
MVSYLQTYTLGSIIRSSFAILFRNWGTLFAIYAVPSAPVFALKLIVAPRGILPLVAFGALQGLLAMFASYPATVAVSEYCLGIKPTFQRSYARVFAAPVRLLTTILLSSAIIGVGFILLIVPGLVFSVWYMFAGSVMVLEGFGGKAALRRSRELGRGFYLRNVGVSLVTGVILGVSMVVISGVLGAFLGVLWVRLGVRDIAVWNELVGSVVSFAVTPVGIVAGVLLYYDMRARKEGYAAAQLAEDIRT